MYKERLGDLTQEEREAEILRWGERLRNPNPRRVELCHVGETKSSFEVKLWAYLFSAPAVEAVVNVHSTKDLDYLYQYARAVQNNTGSAFRFPLLIDPKCFQAYDELAELEKDLHT